MRVLVVEDGLEYTEALRRFLGERHEWVRAGTGGEAIERLDAESFDAVFLDMRFDRIPVDALLGDPVEVADRFNGDPVQARNFLQDHQGNFVLAAIRDAGHRLPVLFSYDFGSEHRRWRHLEQRYAPLAYVPDSGSPAQIEASLIALLGER